MTSASTNPVFLWAQSIGAFLFPIRPGWKSPAGVVRSWQEEASNEPRQWVAWEAANPGCNWGVDLGKSGLFVADIDVSKVGRDAALQAARDWWSKHGGGELVSPLIVGTPTGGWHLYFRNADRSVHNRVLIPGVLDIRGDGGYVVAPFSSTWKAAVDPHVKADGVYQIIDMGAPGVPATATPEVVGALRPPERTSVDRGPATVVAGRGTLEFARQAAFALSDFERRLRGLAEAGEGERNKTLHHTAVEGWKYATAGLLDPADVETWLIEAAAACGLDGQEVPKTIRSAASMVTRGAADPLSIPEGPRTHAAIFGNGELSGLPGEIPFQVPEVLGYLARKARAIMLGRSDGLPGRARALCLDGARACNLGIPENIVTATLIDAYREAKLDESTLAADWKEARGSRSAMRKDLLLRQVKAEIGEAAGPASTTETAGQDLMARDVKEVAQIVAGFLPRGSAVWMGKPKSGKGWNTLKLALMTATGGDFCGLRCTKCSVLYYTFEENSDTISLRMKAIMAGRGLDAGADITVVGADNHPAGVDRGGLDYVRNWAADERRADAEKLVIIDTFGKFKSKRRASGDAYENAEIAMAPIAHLAEEFPKMSVIITHHVRKQTNESDDITDLASGGNSIVGGVDTVIHNAFDEETGLIELRSLGRKQSGLSTLLGAKGDAGIRPRTQDDEAAAATTEDRLHGREREVLQVLRDAGPEEKLSVSAMTDRVGGKRSTVYRALNRLVKSGLAVMKPGGTGGNGGCFSAVDPNGPKKVEVPTAVVAKQEADYAAGAMAPPAGLSPVAPGVVGRDRAGLPLSTISPENPLAAPVPVAPTPAVAPMAEAHAAFGRLQEDWRNMKGGWPARLFFVIERDLATLARANPGASRQWRQELAPLLAPPTSPTAPASAATTAPMAMMH